jgi:nicotinate dehydrogenase subunit A
MQGIRFRLNGVAQEVEVDPDLTLLELLRGHFGLAGAHFGCGSGECGACRVVIGDHAVTSCDTPLWSVADKDITTLEGLGSMVHPHPLQRAFITEQAMQCGYCAAGVLMSAAALLMKNSRPSEAEVRAALDRNLCRCGAHNRMVRAVLAAANEMAAPS